MLHLVFALACCLPATSVAANPGPAGQAPEQATRQEPLDAGQRHGARSIEVNYHGTWYAARVLEHRAGLTKIRYVGWGPEWDEWVESDRLRSVVALGRARVGQRVQVEWGGSWWPARVVAKRANKFEIQYEGYGEEWNEWVGRDRLRAAVKRVAVARAR